MNVTETQAPWRSEQRGAFPNVGVGVCGRLGRWCVGWFLVLTGLFSVHAAVDYSRDVAPILRTHCLGCHDDATAEGGFSVETFARLRQGGDKGDPVRPGDAGDSLLIKLMEGRARPAMPPKEEARVPAADIAVLRRWIETGAPGPREDVSLLRSLEVPRVPTKPGVRRPWTALSASPDGDRVLVGATGAVELRDPSGRRVLRRVDGIPGKVQSVRFSPDARHWVIGAGLPGVSGVAQIRNASTGTLEREFGGHRDAVQDAVMSPDGQWLATGGYDRRVRLFRVGDGAVMWTNSVHNGAVFALAFDPSGRVLATASADQTVKLWRVSDGARLDTLNQAQGEMTSVAFLPDGSEVLAAGADRRVYRWKFMTRDAPGLNPLLGSRFVHEAAVVRLQVSPDGRALVTAGADRSLKRWSLPGLEERGSWNLQSEVVSGLGWLRDGRGLAVARLDGTMERLRLPRDPEVEGVRSTPIARLPAKVGEGGSGEVAAVAKEKEAEPNDTVAEARRVTWPVEIQGHMQRPGDVDVYRFRARKGEEVALVIDAARSKSQMDSRIEVLDGTGRPVEQVTLQAVMDSWFTFRGKDSDTSDDFRLQNWAQMELDEYLYANGEVVRLWLYPRGPDSGFKVYPGTGRRRSEFWTTPVTHALNEPCYVVRPLPPGSRPLANGLPVFRIPWENDDDPARRSGTDSFLVFRAPEDGEYAVRVSDTRRFGGVEGFHYTLAIRHPRPDFEVNIEGLDAQVSPGSGREVRFEAVRKEGFEGAIRVEVSGLPPGFELQGPVEIEAGQMRASAVLWAAENATTPDEAARKAVRVSASAEVAGRTVRHELGGLGAIGLGGRAKVRVAILPGEGPVPAGDASLEFTIRPGETVRARVRAERVDFNGRIELGGEDSGRNLPHGVYVDNIGLNGLLIVEGQTEREFFIRAARKAPAQVRRFHLRASGDGGQCSRPVVLRVVR